MKIGVISDSHDNCDALKNVMEIFRQEGVGFVIHAGDIVAPFTAKIMEDSGMDYRGIFGNNDGEKEYMKEVTNNKISSDILELEIEGKKIFVIHDIAKVDGIQYSNYYDLIIHGHTHEPEEKKISETLVINPGELGGWLNGKQTYMIVDLENMSVKLETI